MRLSKKILDNQVHNLNTLLKLKPFAPHSYILDKDDTGYKLQQFIGDNGTTNDLSNRLSIREMHYFLLGILTWVT